MLEDDKKYMQRCVTLAYKGRYTVKTGALVGCIIVKNAQVVAEGWHQYPGQAHAEIAALKVAGEKAQGATLYVSLEPCAHWGKTGPCCDAVIAAGIVKVVFGMQDPNPLVAGKGLARIKAAGIELAGPVLPNVCEKLNLGFIKRVTKGLPYVRCKLAMSLDGRTAMASGESKWITGAEARADVQELRAKSAVIMTGIGTLLEDNPSLNARLAEVDCVQPIRVVVDSQLKTPKEAKIFQNDGKVLLVSALEKQVSNANFKKYAFGNVELKNLPLPNSPQAESKVDLHKLLSFLAQEKHCNDIFLESGSGLAGAMMNAGLIDEIITYVAPKLLGSEAKPLFDLPGKKAMSEQVELEFIEMLQVGSDYKICSRVVNKSEIG